MTRRRDQILVALPIDPSTEEKKEREITIRFHLWVTHDVGTLL